MTLARHEITGLVADLPDEVIDHPELGKLQTRVESDKPRVIPAPGSQKPQTNKDED